MRYVSFCSGVEAATLAWHDLGWEPIAFSEIDPFPCAVLAERFPNVPNLGDCTKIHYDQNTKELYVKEQDGTVSRRVRAGDIDLCVGGFPCQSFSNAGKRLGLEGASGLIKEYFRLLTEMRPRWFVYENVPGMLSSNNGRDFRFILKCFDEIGYSLAWRVLDAQYTRTPHFPRAIPQRRRRVFVVGHLGTDWRYPAQVLLEPAGLFGSTPPRRVKGKGFAAGVEGRIGSASAMSLVERAGKPGGGKGLLIADERMQTMQTNNNQIVFSIDPKASNAMKSANPNSGFHEADCAKTLDTTDPSPTKAQGGQVVCEKCYPICGMIVGPNAQSKNQSYGIRAEGEPSPSLSTQHHHAVAQIGVDAYNQSLTGDVSQTIRAQGSHNERIPCERERERERERATMR